MLTPLSAISMTKESTLDIVLDSDLLVLRASATEDEAEPAVLSGHLLLKLGERTSIKDISAKLSYSDGSSSFKISLHEHPIFFHNFSFLPEHSDHRDHTHTLNAGAHTFPFRLSLPPDLPPSSKTFLSSGIMEYKLKATVARVGFASTNWSVKKMVHVVRGLQPGAIEYNATVDLENTWPGKILYHFVLPHKAFAAGTEIPVSIHFTPLSKGVRVLNITTEIRENTIITAKNGAEHADSNPVFINRYELQRGSHTVSRAASRPASRPPSRPLSRIPSRTDLSSSSVSGLSPPNEGSTPSNGDPLQVTDLQRRLTNISLSHANPHSNASTPPVASSSNPDDWIPDLEPEPEFDAPPDSDDLPPEEVHLVVKVPIPAFLSASTTLAPLQISHRIKWSCLIKNSDGHTSELRCALPIIIMDKALEDEVALATSGARNLLFGQSGALIPDRASQVQAGLPSYQDHVLDRVPNPLLNPVNVQPNPWAASRNSSPNHTPVTSRPGSPTGMRAVASTEDVASLNLPMPDNSPPALSHSTSHSSTSSNMSRFFGMRRNHSSSCTATSDDQGDSTASSHSLFHKRTKPKKGASFKLGPSLMTASLSRQSTTTSTTTSTVDSTPPIFDLTNPQRNYFVNVPSYDYSAMLAHGGVTPLASLRGLPSYDEQWAAAARSSEPIDMEHM